MGMQESSMCFGCSEKNPCGLQLATRMEGEKIFTEYTARKEHEGYQGVLHGGITASILDELMGCVLQEKGIYGMTAKLEISYHYPVMTGDRLTCFAEIVNIDGRKIKVRSVAKLMDGTIVANGEALYIQVEK